MGSQKVGEPALSDSASSLPYHHILYSLPFMQLHPTNPSCLVYHEGSSSSYNFGTLEEAVALRAVKIKEDDIKQPLYSMNRPAAFLEMFPSWPMRSQHPLAGGSSKSGEESVDTGSAVNTRLLEPESPMEAGFELEEAQLLGKMNREKRRGLVADSEKVLDAKSLKRLAQNREAARKSRLRKKAYVQQLETSRIRLTQLEQDLQRARTQGVLYGGAGLASGNLTSGAVIFDMEYSRWLEDDHRQINELRTALQAHLSDGDLRVIVDGYISHYDEIFRLKGVAAKSDIFHLITGMWTTPAERCFLWIGGFRPSDLIKMLVAQLDPLTEQQVVGIYRLQQSSQQAEEALSQGLGQLQQSVIETLGNGSVGDNMHQMVVASGKLANLEGFVRQADNLRQQTLHQLRRILTVRQAARCFLVIGEFNGRLRALSSLWATRPLE